MVHQVWAKARNLSAFTALAAMAMAAQAAELSTTQVTAPATLTRGGTTTALNAQQALQAGDVVSAGTHGRIGLQLGAGAITLFTMGDLQVFDAKGPKGSVAANGKFKLLAGAARVDSRATRLGQAQDVRLNVGAIKSRIYGADVWAASTAEGDTLCLLAGTVEAQSAGESTRRLDTANTCLRTEPDGRLNTFAIADDPLVARTIAATTATPASDSSPAPAMPAATPPPVAAAAAIAPAPKAKPAPASAPIIAKAASVPLAATPAKAAAENTSTGWTVVVLSLPNLAPVETRTQELIGRGLPAAVRTATVKGQVFHRVTVGRFATQAEAHAYLAKSGLKGWIAAL